MSLLDQSVEHFLEELASKNAVPGGGSVAALSGALAASLLVMVCRLTIGKKGYESVSAEMEEHLDRLIPLEADLQSLIQQDIDAYRRVMDSYGLAKASDWDRSVRLAAIQSALKIASSIPLQVAEQCADVLRLARPIAERGNKNAASDAGVGALMAEAGLRGATFNVSINLGTIQDPEFVVRCKNRVAELLAFAEPETAEILRIVEGRL